MLITWGEVGLNRQPPQLKKNIQPELAPQPPGRFAWLLAQSIDLIKYYISYIECIVWILLGEELASMECTFLQIFKILS